MNCTVSMPHHSNKSILNQFRYVSLENESLFNYFISDCTCIDWTQHCNRCGQWYKVCTGEGVWDYGNSIQESTINIM